MRDIIKIIQPKPYKEISGSFVVEGWVPKSWLDVGFGIIDNRVFLDFLDIDGQFFTMANADVITDKSWLSKFKRKLRFHVVVQFNEFNIPFIVKSQGRITIELRGHKKGRRLFIPIIIKNSNPDFKPDPEIVNKHGKVGKMILQYEKDLKKYDKK